MNILGNITTWIDSHQEEDITIEEVVFQKLKKHYSKLFSYTYLPHYLNWTKDNCGIPLMKIFFKENEDESLPIPWAKEPILSKTIMEYSRRQSAKRTYEEELLKLGDGNPYRNYYKLLSDLIISSKEFLLYDAIVSSRFEKKRKQTNILKISSNGKQILENGLDCDWIWKLQLKLFPDRNNELGSDKEFATYARKRLQNKSVVFPYNFSYEVTTNDELLIENYCKELQMSLIYDDKLRTLFKNNPKQDLGVFLYENACKRTKPLFPNLKTYDIESREEYIYIIEKLTGINLAYCYTKYYTRIKEMLHGTMPNEMIEGILLSILEDFIDMPNILTRTQVVKEFMEPILFFNDDIMKRLCYLKESSFKLNLKLNNTWETSIQNLFKQDVLNELENLHFDMKDKIKNNAETETPFIFIETTHNNELCPKDFAIVFRHTIKRLILNYNI